MKGLISVLLAWASIFSTFAQQDTLPSDKDLAKLYIQQLKNGGALVIRIKSRDKNIAAYRSAGQEKIAERMLQDDRKLNLQIMDAFRTQFRFCPYYFMYARNSRSFVEGKRNVLVNEGLREDSTIKFEHSNFLFVDFGTSMINESVNPYTQVSQTQEGSTPGNSQAYIILDTNFKQLHAPFPYHTFINDFEQNQHQKAVARLNRKLFQFYINSGKNPEPESLTEKKKKKK